MGEVGEGVLSKALNTLGSIFLGISKFEAAASVTEEALTLIQKSKGNSREALLLVNLATMQAQVGEYEKAENRLFQALKVSQTLGDKNFEMLARINLGNLFLFSFEKASLDEVIEILEPGLLLAKEIQARMIESHFYLHIGICFYRSGNFQKSKEYCLSCLQNAKLINDLSAQAGALFILGRISLQSGDLKKAKLDFLLGLSYAKNSNDTSQMLDGLICLAELEYSSKPANALELLAIVSSHQNYPQYELKKILTSLSLQKESLPQFEASLRSLEIIIEDILRVSESYNNLLAVRL
jgi:tetratricopeptide (TPR) repeat protein